MRYSFYRGVIERLLRLSRSRFCNARKKEAVCFDGGTVRTGVETCLHCVQHVGIQIFGGKVGEACALSRRNQTSDAVEDSDQGGITEDEFGKGLAIGGVKASLTESPELIAEDGDNGRRYVSVEGIFLVISEFPGARLSAEDLLCIFRVLLRDEEGCPGFHFFLGHIVLKVKIGLWIQRRKKVTTVMVALI